MKKYVKPELFYEHYELSQHIADCAWELTSNDEYSCSAEADTGKIDALPNLFMSTTSGCVLNEKIYHDFCYHGGAGGVNSFKS